MILMINSKKVIVVILIGLLLFTGCNSPIVVFSPEQHLLWKADVNGCKNTRFEILKSNESKLEKLLGSSETEIKKIFGQPEKIDLGKRSEKFYFYHLEPSDKCENKKFGLKRVLSVRFNAINKASEIIITQK
jgi:hypothetical protein